MANLPIQNPNAAFQTATSNAPVGTAVNTFAPAQPIDVAALGSTPSLNLPPTIPAPPAVPDVSSIFQSNDTPTVTAYRGIASDLSGLSDAAAQRTAFQAAQETTTGIPQLRQTVTDLTGRLNSLKANAEQIPLQIQNSYIGRGATAAGVQPIQDAQLRENTIQQLGVSAMLNAANGNLTTAMDQVDRAVKAKFDPIQAQIDAKKTQLAAIEPLLTNEQKTQAVQQQAKLAQQEGQLAFQRQQYTNTQNEILKYVQVAPATVLREMQSAQSPAAVGVIAAQNGIQEPGANRYKDIVTSFKNLDGTSGQVARILDTYTGKYINASPGTSAAQLNSSANAIVGAGGTVDSSLFTAPHSSTSSSGLSFDRYGLLAHTNLNPSSNLDLLAQKYLDTYIKKGSLPSTRDLGNGITAPYLAQIANRAADLYNQATGNPLPTPDIIKGYQGQLVGNNKLLNNLNVQEGTIGANAALLLKNLNENNLNQNIQPLNSFIDNVRNMLGDPAVAQYLAQHATVSNELGSLLSLKNAQGTTVHDKLEAAEIIDKKDSNAQIASKVRILLQEAVNAHDAIASANAELYKQTDPLLQDANNPARGQVQHSSFVEQQLAKQNLNYNSLVNEMQSKAPPGHQPALDARTGRPVFATAEDIRSGNAIPL